LRTPARWVCAPEREPRAGGHLFGARPGSLPACAPSGRPARRRLRGGASRRGRRSHSAVGHEAPASGLQYRKLCFTSGNAASAAPAARTRTRRWSVGAGSHAGAWEPEEAWEPEQPEREPALVAKRAPVRPFAQPSQPGADGRGARFPGVCCVSATKTRLREGNLTPQAAGFVSKSQQLTFLYLFSKKLLRNPPGCPSILPAKHASVWLVRHWSDPQHWSTR
jgi:hypothetical protein